MKKMIILFYCTCFIMLSIFFNPLKTGARQLTLEESIEIAFDNNLELQIMKYDIDMADTGIKIAESALKPELSFTHSYTRQKEREEPEFPEEYLEFMEEVFEQELPEEMFDFGEVMPEAFEDEIFRTAFDLSYPVYTGGKLTAALEKAEKAFSMTELQYYQKQTSLAREVAEAYYEVLELQKMIELNKEFLQQAEEFLELTENQYQAGVVTESDVLQAEAEKASVKRNLVQAETGLNMAKRNFKYLLGLPGSVNFKLVDIGVKEIKEPLDKREAINIARDKNPGLKLLENRQGLTEKDIEIAEAEKMPNIFAAGNYSWQNPEWSLDDGHWTVTLGLDYEIYDGGRRDAEIESVVSEYEQSEEQYNHAVEEIEQRLDILYEQFKEIQKSISLIETQKKAAKDNLDLTEIRYEEGLVTALEITTAQTEVRQTKTELLQMEYEYLKVKARLAELLGYKNPRNFY